MNLKRNGMNFIIKNKKAKVYFSHANNQGLITVTILFESVNSKVFCFNEFDYSSNLDFIQKKFKAKML